MAKQLPKFEGRSPIDFEADILRGSFGRSVDREVHRLYPDFPTIEVVRYNAETKRVEGSTPDYVIAVNKVIRPEGLQTATVADAKLIRLMNKIRTQAGDPKFLNLSGTYEDLSLVLRNLVGTNGDVTKQLVGERKYDLPITANLCDLDLNKDSGKGLGRKLRDGAQIIPGDVAEYKGSAAASRLCLTGDEHLYSGDDHLPDSDPAGRVVIVRGGATAQKLFEEYYKQLQDQRERFKKQFKDRSDLASKGFDLALDNAFGLFTTGSKQ